MYLDFFGFEEPPFKLSPDPRFFFFSQKHQEAFSHILYGLKERKGFIVIIGEVGTGKTTLSRLLLDKLDSSVRTSLLFNPQLTTVELLQSINQDFGLKGEGRSKKVLLDELNHFLLDLLSKGGNALLIIDEAQLLTTECLEEIRLLSNLETNREKLIQILLIGQPELKEKLEQRELRQLKQRISLWYEIAPLGREEVAAYIRSRIQIAGGENEPLFAPAAIDRIYRFSGGFPRLINMICDQSLLAAYVAERRQIGESIVERAIAELGQENDRPGSERSRKKSAWKRRDFVWAASLLVFISFALIGGGSWRGYFVTGPPGEAVPVTVPILSSAHERKPERDGSDSKSAETASLAASRFDENGIFRVGALSETEKGAYFSLLNLWIPLSSKQGWGMKETEPAWPKERLFEWMKGKNLRPRKVPLEMKKILTLNSPLLFFIPEMEGAHYQVLAGVKRGKGIVLDPLNGMKTVPLRELEARWSGTGVVFSQEEEEPLSPPEGGDPFIRKIQEILKKEGFYSDEVDGIQGPKTIRALRLFQQREGVVEDEPLGERTRLLLANRDRLE